MNIKTADLIGPALDWVVVKCEHAVKKYKYGSPVFNPKTKRVYETQGLEQIGVNFAPSIDWAQGGPIIEREKITIGFDCGWVYAPSKAQPEDEPDNGDRWLATMDIRGDQCLSEYGPTPLAAAMRCFVASKLGDEVEIPDELMPSS